METIANLPNSAMLLNTGQSLTHYINDKLWVIDTQGYRTSITSLDQGGKGYQWIVEYNQSNNQWTVVEVILRCVVLICLWCVGLSFGYGQSLHHDAIAVSEDSTELSEMLCSVVIRPIPFYFSVPR